MKHFSCCVIVLGAFGRDGRFILYDSFEKINSNYNSTLSNIDNVCKYDRSILEQIFILPNKQYLSQLCDIYNKVNMSRLSNDLKFTILLKQGIARIYKKDFSNAYEIFSNLDKSYNDDERIQVVSYFLGFLEVKQKKFASAIDHLHIALQNKLYIVPASYALLECYIRSKRYKDALEYIDSCSSIIDKRKLKSCSCEGILKLLGDICLLSKNYKQAVDYYSDFLKIYTPPPHLVVHDMEIYSSQKEQTLTEDILDEDILEEDVMIDDSIVDDMEVSRSSCIDDANTGIDLTNVVKIRLAYAYYMSMNVQEAQAIVDQLKTREDYIGQLAKYYNGYLLLRNNCKNEALGAFNEAYKMKHNRSIRANSLFNIINLQIIMENKDAAMRSINDFRKTFFDSSLIGRVNELFAEICDKNGNYDVTISSLASLRNKNSTISGILQKNNINKGHICFMNGVYDEAEKYYKESLTYQVDKDRIDAAYFWIAECCMKLKNYDGAIKSYRNVSQQFPAYDDVLYGSGYAHFHNGDYKEALESFHKMRNATDKVQRSTKMNDIGIRIADCLMMDKQYTEAVKAYENMSSTYPDHCLYYKGIVFETLNEYDKALDSFIAISNDYKMSPYYNRSLLEAGKMYAAEKQYTKALDKLSAVKDETLTPIVLVNKANVYTNMNDIESAKKCYTEVLRGYIGSEYAIDALVNLSTYAKSKSEKDFLEQCKKKISKNSLINAEIEITRQSYYARDYKQVVDNLLKNIEHVDDDLLRNECYYMLGDSYRHLKNLEQSISWYSKLTHNRNSTYFIPSTLAIVDILYKEGKLDDAINRCVELQKITSSDKDKYRVLTKLIDLYKKKEDYGMMINCAKDRIKLNDITANNIDDSNLVVASGYVSNKQYKLAEEIYKKLLSKGDYDTKAEAQYMMAYIDYKRNDYKKSINKIEVLIKDFENNIQFYNKGFILLAKDYMALNNNKQAKEILNSLVKYATNKSIKEQAKTLLKKCVTC